MLLTNVCSSAASYHLSDAALHDAIQTEAFLGFADAHLACMALFLENLECGQGGWIHGQNPVHKAKNEDSKIMIQDSILLELRSP